MAKCKACATRKRKGLEGLCPTCANERSASKNSDHPDHEVRVIAANQRAGSAIEHLATARTQIDAALADLSSVVGAAELWRRLYKLADELKAVDIALEHHEAWEKREPWKLDHTPKTEAAKRHGCNLAVLMVALVFAAGCTDHGEPSRPDASPKYDACDPTISKDCPPPDAAKPIPPDAVLPLQSCESLGCSYADYIATCSHSFECVCNNQTCQGTAQ